MDGLDLAFHKLSKKTPVALCFLVFVYSFLIQN